MYSATNNKINDEVKNINFIDLPFKLEFVLYAC